MRYACAHMHLCACAPPPHAFVIGIDGSRSVGQAGWDAEMDFAVDLAKDVIAAGHKVAAYW